MDVKYCPTPITIPSIDNHNEYWLKGFFNLVLQELNIWLRITFIYLSVNIKPIIEKNGLIG